MDEFVADLEATHDVKKTEVSINGLWKERLPAGTKSSDLSKYLKDVSGMPPTCVAQSDTKQAGVTAFCYGVHQELKQFREDYRAKYSKEPYVNPVMRWR